MENLPRQNIASAEIGDNPHFNVFDQSMRFDSPHMFKGKMIGKHMNLEIFNGTKPEPYEHILYDMFKYWIL